MSDDRKSIPCNLTYADGYMIRTCPKDEESPDDYLFVPKGVKFLRTGEAPPPFPPPGWVFPPTGAKADHPSQRKIGIPSVVVSPESR